MRRRLGALVAASSILAACGLLLPGLASAITRAQANQLALQTLNPQAETGPAVVFGLPKPLKAKDVVTEFATPNVLKKRGRAAWLYWEDLDPGAMFQHESRALLVDDKTGKVTKNASLSYFPLVNGKPPAYFKSNTNYFGPTYQIFSNLAAPTGPPAVGRPVRHPRLDPTLTSSLAPPAAPSASGDCLLIVVGPLEAGLQTDNGKADIEAWKAFAESRGMPVFAAKAKGGVDDAALNRIVDSLVSKEGCKDIMIWILGHGTGASEGAASILTAVKEGSPNKYVTPGGLEAAIRKQEGKATFKILIESCFAERFDEVALESNVKILIGSSHDDQTSKFNESQNKAYPTPAAANTDKSEFSGSMTEALKGEPATLELASALKDALPKSMKYNRAWLVDDEALKSEPSEIDHLEQTSCSGEMKQYKESTSEVITDVSCPRIVPASIGRPSFAAAAQASGFDIQLPGNRAVTNWLDPAGFTCHQKTRKTTNDTLSCTGTLTEDATAEANIRMSPDWTAGMGAQLFIFVGGIEQGPFAITGP